MHRERELQTRAGERPLIASTVKPVNIYQLNDKIHYMCFVQKCASKGTEPTRMSIRWQGSISNAKWDLNADFLIPENRY